MAKIPSEVQDAFNRIQDCVFATARKDAQPNCNIVAIKKIIDDETLYLSDQFYNKTLKNLEENEKVAVLFWDQDGAYEIYGTARYVNEGPEFEEHAAWSNAVLEQIGVPAKSKGGCFVHVEAVYSSIPGPDAGAQIA
ncbi:MAG: pyridoxamine 5'-phosphate oxidase family protein [Coriobacteriia bacterium]|nr:pyridoxamine 5'-phosphate oxidase family protein [Coriobacteriia bacterium]